MGNGKHTALDIMTIDPSKRPSLWEFFSYSKLEDAVNRFFEILDIKEETDSGVEFHPNKMDFDHKLISSVRVHNTAELRHVFAEMKRLSHYNETHLPINSRHQGVSDK